MKFKILEADFNERIFRIEEDYPSVGSNLYIYENGKCIKDFLQNSIKDCMEFAEEEFGLPVELWVEIKEGSL
jgi:hypothetical protein